MKHFLSYNLFPLFSPEAEGSSGGNETADAPPPATAETTTSDSSPSAPESSTSEGEESTGPASSPSESTEQAPPVDWRDKRIAVLTAKLREARQEKAGDEAPASKPLDPTEDFNRRVEAAAAERVATLSFNKECNDAAKRGQEKYGEAFDKSLVRLRQLVDSSDPKEVQKYNSFLSVALRVGRTGEKNLEDFIHDLGSDPTKAISILELDPTDMSIELMKMSTPLAPADTSKLAKPIRPVGAASLDRGPVQPDDPNNSDKLSTAEWMRRREAQISASRR